MITHYYTTPEPEARAAGYSYHSGPFHPHEYKLLDQSIKDFQASERMFLLVPDPTIEGSVRLYAKNYQPPKSALRTDSSCGEPALRTDSSCGEP